MSCARTLLALVTLVLPLPAATGGELFDAVVRVLSERFYDHEARAELIPALAQALGGLAEQAHDLEEERVVVGVLLESLAVSHLALYSRDSYQVMQAELMGSDYPTLGMQLTRRGEGYFVDWVYEGGPAARAGLLRGERVLAVDGLAPEHSPRLDWSTDDAALPDPPLHGLLTGRGEAVGLTLSDREVTVVAERYSGWSATRASATVLEREGARLGYVHLWFVPMRGPADLLRELCRGRFADCEGLVLDLRGRGGSATEVPRILRVLEQEWPRPLVALVDRGTRSAKEVLAHEIVRRGTGLVVGEATAGAVIPATFERVGEDAVLMFPAFTLGDYTTRIEGKPIQPDVWVEDELRSPEDEILEAGIVTCRSWLDPD